MRYAVEAKVFNNGKIVAKVRDANPEDKNGCTETRTCDVWIDLFDSYEEALKFKNDYKKVGLNVMLKILISILLRKRSSIIRAVKVRNKTYLLNIEEYTPIQTQLDDWKSALEESINQSASN